MLNIVFQTTYIPFLTSSPLSHSHTSNRTVSPPFPKHSTPGLLSCCSLKLLPCPPPKEPLLIMRRPARIHQAEFFLFNFYWSVVKWISCTCTHTHSLLDALPIQVITEDWVEFPAQHDRLFFVICLYMKMNEVTQSCLTLCDPVDCSLPGLSVHGIFQARVPEWVAISFSRGYSWPRDWTQVSHIAGRLFTLWATREAI